MSVSYNSGVILGVKMSEIGFKAEKISTPYDVHDKKGNKTGKVEYETSWKFTFKGVETVESNTDPDVIEDIISAKKPLEIFTIDYDDVLDSMIVGVKMVKVGYNEYYALEEIKIEDKLELVKAELMNQFGVDVEPKLYFYFNVSY